MDAGQQIHTKARYLNEAGVFSCPLLIQEGGLLGVEGLVEVVILRCVYSVIGLFQFVCPS